MPLRLVALLGLLNHFIGTLHLQGQVLMLLEPHSRQQLTGARAHLRIALGRLRLVCDLRSSLFFMLNRADLLQVCFHFGSLVGFISLVALERSVLSARRRDQHELRLLTFDTFKLHLSVLSLNRPAFLPKLLYPLLLLLPFFLTLGQGLGEETGLLSGGRVAATAGRSLDQVTFLSISCCGNDNHGALFLLKQSRLLLWWRYRSGRLRQDRLLIVRQQFAHLA